MTEVVEDNQSPGDTPPSGDRASASVIRALGRLAWNTARALLPYPDLRRRLRVRSAARKLVDCTPWPGDDGTPLQVAQLSLLRSLWLQREAHRAFRARQREATTLLARSAVENCILGLYCLYAEAPMEELRADNARQVKTLFKYLEDREVVTPRMFEILGEEIGAANGRQLPKVFDMARHVVTRSQTSLTTDMYRRIYTPLSSFFAHANGIALLRHVRHHDAVNARPSYPWVRRSPVHVADSCVGVLGNIIAARSGTSSELFAAYANAHMGRVLAPLFTFAGQSARWSVRWSYVPTAMRFLIEGRRYYQTSDTVPWDERARTIRDHVSRILSVFEVPITPVGKDALLDEFVIAMIGPKPQPVL